MRDPGDSAIGPPFLPGFGRDARTGTPGRASVIGVTSDRTATPSVSVIIVTHNSADEVSRPLESLAASTIAGDLECVVVDCASTDATIEAVRREYRDARVIAADNVGFAEGNNIGVAASSGEYVLMLNPDAWVEPTTIDVLRRTLIDHPEFGAVGATVRHPDGRIQEVGNRLDWFGFPIPQRPDEPGTEIVRDAFFVSGCGVLLRRRDWERVGGLDGRLFMFVEEVDLCWRLQLAGLRTVVVPDVVIWHVGGASLDGGYAHDGRHETNDQRIYLRERNTLAVALRNGSVFEIGAVALGWLVNALEIVVFALTGRGGLARQYLRALTWNWRRRHETRELRRATRSGLRWWRSAPRGRSVTPGKLVLLRQSGIPLVSR